MAYKAPEAHFVDGFSKILSLTDVRSWIDKDSNGASQQAVLANNILRYFHLCCAEAKAFDGISNAERLDFLGMLDSLVCRSICGKHLGLRHDTCPTLAHVAESFLQGLNHKGNLRARGVVSPAKPWASPAEEVQAMPKSKKNQEPALLPKIINFVSGQADGEQEVLFDRPSEEIIEWAPLMTFPEAETARAHLTIALHELTQALVPLAADKVDLKRNSFGDIVVEAKVDIPRGSVAFAPSVSGPGFIVSRACGDGERLKPLPPNAISIPDWFGQPLAIMPCARLPPRGLEVSKWEKISFLSPFWAMTHSPIPERANCSKTGAVDRLDPIELKLR